MNEEHRRLLELCEAEDRSEYQQLAQFLGETFKETEPVSALFSLRLAGIHGALEEAHARMKHAAAEYEAIGAHEEAERAAAIRKSIMALIMERW